MKRPRQSERGYALIFVFVMSAMMAMMLYTEMPRLSLEMQRNREELLIARGEEYVRAIKVFMRKNKKRPQTIEELESLNGVRFLRRRYVDPMTGKDEWRLIHADAGGRLTDSLVQKQAVPGQTPEQQSTNTFVSEGPSFGSAGDSGPGRVAQALNRRASEQPGAAGAPPAPGENNPQGAANNGDPQQQQQQQPPQQAMVPIIGPNGQPIQRIPGLPGQFGAGSPYPVQPASSQTGGAVPQQTAGGYTFGSGYSGAATPPTAQNVQPGQPGFQPGQGAFRPGGGSVSLGTAPVPGTSPQGIAVNPATSMIQQILTRPNPQGLANIQGGAGAGQAIGGGIAGVASKYDAEGIKVYNDRTNYKEWEFVYDQSKDQKTAQGQIPGQVPGQNPGQTTGQPLGFSGQTSGFGGQQGGFGSPIPTRR
ncbi:MAG: hypothetical protein HYX27_21345 [Acidobacteria bacterium]|nr:hypothetical protein [Acidobacteriota bacterium]